MNMGVLFYSCFLIFVFLTLLIVFFVCSIITNETRLVLFFIIAEEPLALGMNLFNTGPPFTSMLFTIKLLSSVTLKLFLALSEADFNNFISGVAKRLLVKLSCAMASFTFFPLTISQTIRAFLCEILKLLSWAFISFMIIFCQLWPWPLLTPLFPIPFS